MLSFATKLPNFLVIFFISTTLLVNMDNPNVAIANGIGMVHQHFMLVQPFTVAQNIILGVEPTKGLGSIDINKAIEDVKF